MLPINSIQNVHEDAFKPLISVHNLNMAKNLLHKPPFLTDICDTLEALIISNNNISEIPYFHFIGCTIMRRLDLRKNHITKVTNQTLVGLDSLEQLDLSYNLIITVDCHAFWGLSSVKTIALNFNDIRDFPCYCFKNNAIKITKMNLMANEIENINPSAIKCASSVEVLHFWAAKIDTLDFISSLPNLTTLIVSQNFGNLAVDYFTFSVSFALGHIEIVKVIYKNFRF